MPLLPVLNPYCHSKQLGESIIKNRNLEFKLIILRHFNPIGAHPSGLIGERPSGIPNNLLPYITQTAVGKREFLMVFGDDYNIYMMDHIKDFIHVCDLADAHVESLKYGEKTKKGIEIFNCGTGNGISVLELIRTFERVSGVKLS